MKNKRTTNPSLWDAIKLAYTDTSKTVQAICEQYNVKPHQLYRKVRSENWPLRTEIKNRKSKALIVRGTKHKTSGQLDDNLKKQIRTTSHNNNIETLEENLHSLVLDLMQRIAERKSDSSVSQDRDARTLSSLVRTYEKLKDLEQKTKIKQRGSDNSALGELENNADTCRDEIAAKLEKLIKSL